LTPKGSKILSLKKDKDREMLEEKKSLDKEGGWKEREICRLMEM